MNNCSYKRSIFFDANQKHYHDCSRKLELNHNNITTSAAIGYYTNIVSNTKEESKEPDQQDCMENNSIVVNVIAYDAIIDVSQSLSSSSGLPLESPSESNSRLVSTSVSASASAPTSSPAFSPASSPASSPIDHPQSTIEGLKAKEKDGAPPLLEYAECEGSDEGVFVDYYSVDGASHYEQERKVASNSSFSNNDHPSGGNDSASNRLLRMFCCVLPPPFWLTAQYGYFDDDEDDYFDRDDINVGPLEVIRSSLFGTKKTLMLGDKQISVRGNSSTKFVDNNESFTKANEETKQCIPSPPCRGILKVGKYTSQPSSVSVSAADKQGKDLPSSPTIPCVEHCAPIRADSNDDITATATATFTIDSTANNAANNNANNAKITANGAVNCTAKDTPNDTTNATTKKNINRNPSSPPSKSPTVKFYPMAQIMVIPPRSLIPNKFELWYTPQDYRRFRIQSSSSSSRIIVRSHNRTRVSQRLRYVWWI